MTFASFDLFATIVASGRATNSGGFNTLAINNASTGLLFTTGLEASGGVQAIMDGFPGAIPAPLTPVVLNTRPDGVVLREVAPLAASSYEIKDSI